MYYPIPNRPFPTIQPNPRTTFNPLPRFPVVSASSSVHHNATIIGPVFLGERVFVAPAAVIRADEGSPMYIGNNSNIQDGAVLHGFRDKLHGQHSIHIGDNVSISHQALIHGPTKIGDNTIVGFKSIVNSSTIGKNCVVEMNSTVSHVSIPENRYVPCGSMIDTQEKANALPVITNDYKHKHLNTKVVEVNKELAQGYNEYYRSEQQRGLPNFYYPIIPPNTISKPLPFK